MTIEVSVRKASDGEVSLSIINGENMASIQLPSRAVGKLYSMLGKVQEMQSYEGIVRIKGDKVFLDERMEKEVV